MNFTINDRPHEAEEGANLSCVLSSLDISDLRGWAVAINQNVILRDEYEETLLHEGDEVMLIQASQGG